jgi:ubiquinone biosynthesis UbiH/UbiF/VisC/COQ6 family hydroxylase
MDTQNDVLVIGAGPAGLTFAINLALGGLSVAILEQLPESELCDPAFDGREIALTGHSVAVLRKLGVWQGFRPEDVSALRSARIFNGNKAQALDLQPGADAGAPIARIVSNHRIRKELYRRAKDLPLIRIVQGSAQDIRIDNRGVQVDTAAGATLDARLLAAADSRFSRTRQKLGIGASTRELGRSIVAFRVSLTRPHHGVAVEWFAYDRTLAFLPLAGDQYSVVLTVSAAQAKGLTAMPDSALAEAVTRWSQGRFGPLAIAGTRHVYPLTTVYAERFAGRRAALIGDAAVGMHPVTAHGFNFGLRGQDTLAQHVLGAFQSRQDIGSAKVLRAYDRTHRLATLPLYLATNTIVDLYNRENMPARILRDAVLGAARHLPGMPAMISAALMH